MADARGSRKAARRPGGDPREGRPSWAWSRRVACPLTSLGRAAGACRREGARRGSESRLGATQRSSICQRSRRSCDGQRRTGRRFSTTASRAAFRRCSTSTCMSSSSGLGLPIARAQRSWSGSRTRCMTRSLCARPRTRSETASPNDTGELFVKRALRARFALRFGDNRVDEDRDSFRPTLVREAFNSPFWPFVLVTTSVGQEGLDFHLYCHSVVHWNLPANPVDLEQREGRVHRYKGHAVRKNLACAYPRAALAAKDGDPWAALFSEGANRRTSDENDLVPSWIFTDGPARIERLVPTLPLSRDEARLIALKRSLAAYRLAFGQPRQEDLVAFLRQTLTEEEVERVSEELRIDLAPPSIQSA